MHGFLRVVFMEGMSASLFIIMTTMIYMIMLVRNLLLAIICYCRHFCCYCAVGRRLIASLLCPFWAFSKTLHPETPKP